MLCHHVQHVQNVGPNLVVHNENIAHLMPHGSAHAMTSCTLRMACARRQAGHPIYMWHARNYLWMCFVQAERYLSKLTTSHFCTLNTKFANQNMLKRILSAMLNENKADWNENFRICAEKTIAPLYKW